MTLREQGQVLKRFYSSSEFTVPDRQKVWASLLTNYRIPGPKEDVKRGQGTCGHSSAISSVSANCLESFYNLSPGLSGSKAGVQCDGLKEKTSQCVLVLGISSL